MKAWKTVLITLAISVLTVGAATAAVIYSGAYNVAATSKHWPVTRWVLQQTVHHSIERQAADLETPELGGRQQLLMGAANFDAMCSGCHEPPGARQSVAAQGMYPQPPNLDHAGEEMTANEIYWVLKHGIKASGMPAWGASHGDEQLWAMTAFVKQWPDMSAADYDQLLAAAEPSEIGHHHGGDGHGDGHGDSHGDGHDEDQTDGHGHSGNEGHHGGHDDGHTDSLEDAHAHG